MGQRYFTYVGADHLYTRTGVGYVENTELPEVLCIAYAGEERHPGLFEPLGIAVQLIEYMSRRLTPGLLGVFGSDEPEITAAEREIGCRLSEVPQFGYVMIV